MIKCTLYDHQCIVLSISCYICIDIPYDKIIDYFIIMAMANMMKDGARNNDGGIILVFIVQEPI